MNGSNHGLTVVNLRFQRNAYYRPHTHAGLTTHLILEGELTIWFPRDATPEKKTYSVGERIDVEAGRVHEVWMGSDGCTYVIGE
jgi:quercetin dioxygenase-like cupin family protein